MTEFYDYSAFVNAAYLVSFAILAAFGAFCVIDLKKSAKDLKKQEKTKD